VSLDRPAPSRDNTAPPFTRGAVRPLECLREGWHLIRDDYWLFLAITAVGALLAGLAPLGLLMGPMMCGMCVCLLRRANGQHVEFAMLFRGFNYFVPSLPAGILVMTATTVLINVVFVLFCAGGIGVIAAQPPGGPPDPSLGWALGALAALLGLSLVLLSVAVGVPFAFTFELIVDRELTGGDALAVGLRAVLANFWGVLWLTVLAELLVWAGMACL
jgi:uncharacterized membrane protein